MTYSPTTSAQYAGNTQARKKIPNVLQIEIPLVSSSRKETTFHESDTRWSGFFIQGIKSAQEIVEVVGGKGEISKRLKTLPKIVLIQLSSSAACNIKCHPSPAHTYLDPKYKERVQPPWKRSADRFAMQSADGDLGLTTFALFQLQTNPGGPQRLKNQLLISVMRHRNVQIRTEN